MNQQENRDAARNQSTANAIQKDLEEQLRMFGATVTDSVLNGFEGRGEELGTRAKGVGNAFANAVEQEVRSALYPEQTNAEKPNPYLYDFQQARQKNTYQEKQTAKKSRWTSMFKKKPSYALEKAASSRYGVGVVQVTFGAIFGLTCLFAGLVCLLVGLLASELGAVIGAVPCLLIGLPLSYMFLRGFDQIKISKRMRRYVTVMDDTVSIPLLELAETAGYATVDVMKDLRKIIDRNWCPLWIDEQQEVLHLSLESYRAAKETLKEEQFQEQMKNQTQQTAPASENVGQLLQNIENFVVVLGKQKQIMQEDDAVEELTRMQETCRDIYDWIKIHPEAAPRMRRFTSYYMPTTLKLLYSYNDVQGQQGDNAQNIRQDIGRFLHTLNTAFDNLHDSLLSSVSLDIASEIAALQGMLAQDGLSTKDDFGTPTILEL